MKALTVKQPWAWAVSLAMKDVENRSRNTNCRGEIAIHAGLQWSKRGAADGRIKGLISRYEYDCPVGVIIAVGWIIDAHPAAGCCQPWGDAEYNGKAVWHWVLADTKRLSEPVPCRGALGLWTVPDDVVSAISGGVAASPDGGE